MNNGTISITALQDGDTRVNIYVDGCDYEITHAQKLKGKGYKVFPWDEDGLYISGRNLPNRFTYIGKSDFLLEDKIKLIKTIISLTNKKEL